MCEANRKQASTRRRADAFTLIELLVVVAILALLISILLPSLAQARAQAKAVKCATNLNHVGKAVHTYLSENSFFPVAYGYLTSGGAVDLKNQNFVSDHKYGYAHWSWFLYGNGQAKEQSFQCPEMPSGGMPRTNPGPDPKDWEPGQVDDRGQKSPNSHEDLQAPRMAYAANAAVMPRNKFTKLLSGGQRVNKLVSENQIKRSSSTIMVTELLKWWQASAIQGAGGLLSKSHRPINPFYHVSTGSNEYAAPISPSGRSGFVYGEPGKPDFGLQPYEHLQGTVGVIDQPALSEFNAIGRHHPGGDSYGGTTNFLYVDGHVERKTVLETLQQREWGDRYYSLNGPNRIEN